MNILNEGDANAKWEESLETLSKDKQTGVTHSNFFQDSISNHLSNVKNHDKFCKYLFFYFT